MVGAGGRIMGKFDFVVRSAAAVIGVSIAPRNVSWDSGETFITCYRFLNL